MKSNIVIIGAHGLGDCLWSINCAKYAERFYPNKVKVVLAVRDEVFKPLQYLFSEEFDIEQHPLKEKWGEDNYILSHQEELNYPDSEIYYVIPDLLFKSPLAFDYKRFHTSPQLIKQTRLLTHKLLPMDVIYCGLATSTTGYLYPDLIELLISLAKELPDKTIYFPYVDTWNGQKLDFGVFPSNLPINLYVHVNPSFNNSLQWLRKSEYFVGTCNGTSHLAFSMGIPRTILDPQHGKLLWLSRWKETGEECISINTKVEDVVNLVKTNVNIPQTTLFDRKWILQMFKNEGYNINWPEKLLFKY